MKAWKGTKRIAKKLNNDYFTEKWYRDTLDYLLNAKPGDLIASCTGWNHRIASVEIHWRTARDVTRWRYCGEEPKQSFKVPYTKTRIAWEATVTDDTGRWHHFPGGGCVSLPDTIPQIEEYWRGWDTPEGLETIREWHSEDRRIMNILEALRKGEPICNELGQPLEKLWKAP